MFCKCKNCERLQAELKIKERLFSECEEARSRDVFQLNESTNYRIDAMREHRNVYVKSLEEEVYKWKSRALGIEEKIDE